MPSIPSQRLWLGVFGAPLAWIIFELVGYPLAARACEPPPHPIIPLGSMGELRNALIPLAIVAALCAALAIAGGLVGWRNWRAVRVANASSGPDVTVGRMAFLSFISMVVSAVFLAGLTAFLLPMFVVHACSAIR